MLDWDQGNELELRAAIERVRLFALAPDGHAPEPAALVAADAELERCAAELAPPPAIEQLAAAFSLAPFERDLLLWCAGAELDGTLGAAPAERLETPTFARALAALPGADWRALTPSAPLRWFRLIEPAPGEPLLHARLGVDEWVLHFLRGRDDCDERVSALFRPASADARLAPSHARAASEMARVWLDGDDEPAAFLLTGADAATRLAVAVRALEEARIEPHLGRSPQLAAAGAEAELTARLWRREVLVRRAGLVLECDDGDPPDRAQSTASWIDALRGPLVVSARDFVRGPTRPLQRVDLGRPTREEQLAQWREALGGVGETLNGGLDAIVGQFHLDASAVAAAAEQVVASLAARPEAPARELLWERCRVHARGRLEDLAQRIESQAGWDDLVLPETERAILHSISFHVRRRAQVHEAWGFAHKGPRGLGTSALFSGTSGTGKTLAAEVIANDLALDLYRIDLSQVVSKYIGETEKNLRRIFDAADDGGAILLFDEADALFGKRSEVSDSHDRYANIEVSYLLQRMEQYRGLAILTSNMRHALDAAFLRRLRFVIEFPFPDLTHRALIWQRVFPRRTPVEGLDTLRLARLNLTGGHIRNIALGAAFLAAEEGASVQMGHLREAARHEFKKLNQPFPERDIADWVT